jgi:hypothetical protein
MPVISTSFSAILPWFCDWDFLKLWYTWDWNSLTSLLFFLTFPAIPECQAPGVCWPTSDSFRHNPNGQRCYQWYTSGFDLFSLCPILFYWTGLYVHQIVYKAKYLMIMMNNFFCRGPSTLSRLLCFVSQGLCACMHWESRSNYQYWAWCCWETSLFHAVRNQIGKHNFMAFKKIL